MATEHLSTFHYEIVRRLSGVRRKENNLSLFYGALTTILSVLVLLFFVVILEGFFSFGMIGRAILFVSAAFGIAAAIGWFLVRPLLRLFGILRSDNNETIARKVGKYFPHIRDRLLDALQMYEGRDALKRQYSEELIDASFVDLYQLIQPIDFSEAVNNFRVRRMRKIVGYAFGMAMLILVISPSGFFNSLYRVVHYNQSFAPPLPIEFVVEPGNVDVVRGQTVPVVIRTQGKPVQSITLQTRQKGQVDFDQQTVKLQNGIFRTEIPNIKLSTEYYASVEDVKSGTFTLNVLDRPLVRTFALTVTPPAYTRLPARSLDENVGDVSAYPGTKVNVDIRSSKDLSSASIVLKDNASIDLATSGADAHGSFVVKKNASYHFLLNDKDNLPNIEPVEYAIKVVPDEFPAAEILSPAKNIDLTEQMKLDLFIRIKDDFGFSKLRLAYRLAQSHYEQPAKEFSFVDIPLQHNQQSPAELWHHWDLSSLHLVPEDAVAYYVEVFDNDNVNGPKSGVSETYIVRLPSLEEVFSDVSQSHEQSLESMQSVAKETQQLKREMEDLQREMKKDREKMDWQQQKKAEEMMQRYEAVKKKLDETAKRMEEMTKQMEDNKLVSEKTLEKYQELQKLMEELKSPELQEALKKLQESMKQLSPEEMKKAMEQLKFSEEQFRQSLERTIELLKRIHIEQKVDELVKRAEEMKKQQEALKEQSKQTNPSDQQKRDELARKQQDLQKQAESLQKEASDLKKKMEEFPKEMPLEQMSKAQQQLEQSKVQQKMQKSAQQMQSGEMQGSQQQQEQSEQDLSEFEEQMKQVQKSMRDNQTKQIVNEMRKQLQNTLELSKREETLKNETKNLDPNSQRFRENAQQQDEVRNDLNNVANKMSELGKKTFAVSPEMARELGDAMKNMDKAMEQMEGRNPGGSSENQGDAMGSLNRAAMMMQQALNGMMNGGQGGMGMAGLMGRLGQLGGQQGDINQSTKDAIGAGQGQGQLSPQQQAEYGRLAGQQAAAQKSLEELSNEAKNAGEFSKLLGDLDRIAKEMSEVQTDLEQGSVNPNTIRKQDHILSRLLDSQRSMRERDYEKRRKADAGKNIQRTSPAEIDLTTQEGKNKLHQELLKVLESKYSKDYETLIKKYFEQLEKEDAKQ
ncbi:MAG: hypothetical protein HY033_04190 [Ignavibacteriae bacterium]|nr:hypothetical protein [Ignavibacteria bacterium]MBI3364088.1 hypothetical protein [Ignavibacteriota bacterium]